MEFRQRDDQRRIFMEMDNQRNGIYGEGRSEKKNLGRGTSREMVFMERDDQRYEI